MKKSLILIVTVFATITSAAANNAGAPLEFIVIHEKWFENSEPINIESLEIEGFRTNKPNFKVTRLEEIIMRPEKRNWARMKLDGSDKIEGVDDVFAIIIRFDKKAQKGFAELSDRNIGKRILIRIGNRSLLAPYVHDKIDTPSIEITTHDEEKAKNIFDALRKIAKTSTEQLEADHLTTSSVKKSNVSCIMFIISFISIFASSIILFLFRLFYNNHDLKKHNKYQWIIICMIIISVVSTFIFSFLCPYWTYGGPIVIRGW